MGNILKKDYLSYKLIGMGVQNIIINFSLHI